MDGATAIGTFPSVFLGLDIRFYTNLFHSGEQPGYLVPVFEPGVFRMRIDELLLEYFAGEPVALDAVVLLHGIVAAAAYAAVPFARSLLCPAL